jgi:hypothetical protein
VCTFNQPATAPAPSNTSAAYVARTAISDGRLLQVTHDSVRFRWKNRAAGHRSQTLTLTGVEFVGRYLRQVLPRGLRSIHYYGFCHPAAKASLLRVQLHSGRSVQLGAPAPVAPITQPAPPSPRSGQQTRLQENRRSS